MPYQHYWLLLLWSIIGACLRFINLGVLPPWTDESATVVFSLGNSFYNVPVNQFIRSQTLLEPLQINPTSGMKDVIDLLLTESTHPPLYFVFTHLWLKLFPAHEGLVSLWAARSLSASLGVLAIPAIFYFTKFAFRSLVAAQIAGLMMAIAPFGIFLAIQARHYTLVILLVIASLACFVGAYRAVSRGNIIPFWLVLTWIATNCIGIATHYFFVLTLGAMAISFLPLMWQQLRQDKAILSQPQWRRLYLVALGSFAGCLVWLPTLAAIQGRAPTDWIYQSNATQRWIEPIGRFLLWLMSMAMLLPSSLYDFSLSVIIVAGLLTLLFWTFNLPRLISGLQVQKQDMDQQLTIVALSRYLLAAIALFFFFTYVRGMDLTLAPRFHFVYFPVVIVLMAVSLSSFWQEESGNQLIHRKKPRKTFGFNSIKKSNKILVVLFLSITLCGGVVANLSRGYLQSHRPDLMVNEIVSATQAPISIATSYKHHGQTGRMIGLAWGLRNVPQINFPQFFLATQDLEKINSDQSASIMLQQLAKIKRPIDLWLINFNAEVNLASQNCLIDDEYDGMAGQYKYKLYRCRD